MAKINTPTEGRGVHQTAGLGQVRVGEPGPGPQQTHPFPPSAGGPGPGSGDDAKPEMGTPRSGIEKKAL